MSEPPQAPPHVPAGPAVEPRPLLAFASPREGLIPTVTGPRPFPPSPQGPGAARQGARLTPRFDELQRALAAGRVNAGATVTDPDPELVVVFDLAGTVEQFARAASKVPGLEFLTELAEGPADSDGDFYTVAPDGRTGRPQNQTAYLVMSNARAVTQLIALFHAWQADESAAFPYGLAPLRDAFGLLRDIRRWGPEDRVRETGLLEEWRETVAVVGSSGTARVEIELWFRSDPARRAAAQAQVVGLVTTAGGTLVQMATLPEIAYHALLVDLPHQQVETVLEHGPAAMELLTTDEVMLISAATTMMVPHLEEVTAGGAPALDLSLPSDPPLVGLLDGVPLANHDVLAGRLVLDDPDGLGARYTSSRQQQHGTAMASLITHGDLDAPGPALPSRLYVRPILRPHPFLDAECVPEDELLVDLLHRAFHRMFDGDGQQPGAAPSVRIVNLSIGDPRRVFVRRLSPLAKLLDWLAHRYNLLLLVSAGNHDATTTVPAAVLDDQPELSRHLLGAARDASLRRRLLSPAEAVNALTIGATHADSWSGTIPDSVLDAAEAGLPALYGAVGAGHRRSVKPEILLPGGRGLYQRPPPGATGTIDLAPAVTTATGPGLRVAAPDIRGGAGATAYTHGTSNATALATRAAALVMRQLQVHHPDDGDNALPDAQYHPVLTKALLVHAASWGSALGTLQDRFNGALSRTEITQLLGYGPLDTTRLAVASRNRATLLGAGTITGGQRHTYRFPLPTNLQATTDWRRLTITLAWLSPVNTRTQRHRSARLWVEPPTGPLQLQRREADHNRVRQGTVQHELLDSNSAVVFADGLDLVMDIDCRLDNGAKPPTGVRYGLVVSLEVGLSVRTDVHAQVRQQLRLRAQLARVRPTR